MKRKSSLLGRKQSIEHIAKRVLTRINNNSYNGQNIGHKPTNTKPNSGTFKKGDKHPRKKIDINKSEIYQDYLEGYSAKDIGDKLGVSEKTIANRIKEFGKVLRKNHSNKIKNKIKIARSKQIVPVKDTSIELKIQSYLKQLGIEFYTHQYIKEIEHGYQCDILIPVQEGINKKTIIECFGDYWHNYPYGNEKDTLRTQELLKEGYRVLVFWENEIRVMELNDLELKLK